MNTTLKKNKSNESLLDEYMSNIINKCEKTMILVKNPLKINDDKISIPTIKTYSEITRYNYNVTQLKSFAKHYKLKISGNKNELLSRIYSYLYFSSYIIKIQKVYRGILARKYKFLHGPASINRKLCTNSSDFVTMEPVEEINYHQFLSYRDDDGFIYGFDLLSIYNLIYKSNGSIKNPFNTKPISTKVVENIRTLLRLSRILHIPICTIIDDVTKDVSSKKSIELRALTLFQNIDALGNYSDVSWFMKLNRSHIIKFLRELIDIWNYRAPLTMETKRAICPPLGTPFSAPINFNYLQTTENLDDVRKYVLSILEKFVTSGIDKDNKCLGAYYVLGALTLVSNDAATSLPWLFQAVAYM